MPSLRNRAVDAPDWMRARERAPSQPILQHFPTPPPIYIARSPVLISSLPGIASTQDAALRQFYGGRILPTRRVTQL
jgi:hypothetical protein